MKTVGLCTTFENANNYGTMLQAYATKRSIEKLGFTCHMIRYKRQYDLKFVLSQAGRVFEKGFFSHEIRRYKKRQLLKTNSAFSQIYNPRTQAVKAFQKKVFLSDVDTFVGYEALSAGSRNYDAIVVGSDQLWLPSGMRTNFYNLMFVDDTVKKISYATSFGVSQIDKTYWKDMRRFIPRIDYLSVREQSGQQLIKDIVGVEAQVVVDPTMLLTKDEWLSIVPNKELVQQDYIFCYFLGRNPDCREFANQLKRKTGLPIVVLKHLDEFIESDVEFGDIAPDAAGPEEFINYIRNAKYILTDSFHGTVFSIIHHKKFLTFYRFKTDDRMSKNSRIDNLLGLMGLGTRLFEADKHTANERLLFDTDYAEVDKKLSRIRDESKRFLDRALNG